MTYKATLQLSARRYSELLEIADRMLKTANFMKELINDRVAIDDTLSHLYGTLPDYQTHCPIIALDYAVSALEAFINHMGYIFHDDWAQYERKNFYDQYKKVIELLKTQKVILGSAYDQLPYPDFQKHRDKRNCIHHPHASEHDCHFEEGGAPFSVDDQNVVLFSKWVSIQLQEAASVYIEIKDFIKNLHELISASQLGININDENRKKLLKDFIGDPFSISVMTIKAMLSPDTKQKNSD